MNNSKKITVRDIVLKLEQENRIDYDISYYYYRGGKYGAKAGDVVAALFPTLSTEKAEELENLLPNKVGVYCNYLGGGLRGALCRSDYSKEMPTKYARRIDDAFTRGECKRRYEEIENELGLNDEEDSDGNINWDALGTRKMREASIESAY
jgi:hypothetical protein